MTCLSQLNIFPQSKFVQGLLKITIMEKVYKHCQSCSISLKNDIHGTYPDGTRSTMFCNLCFKDGKFTHPDWTADQMEKFVKEKMKNVGFPGFLAGVFAKKIHKLERWKRLSVFN